MKKHTLTSLMLLTVLFSFGQGKRTETKIITENGITKKWTITQEFDEQGNLIDYDSTYTETDNPSELKGQNYNFEFGPNQFDYSQRFQEFNLDSTLQKMQLDMNEMMLNMNEMMQSFNVDSLMNEMMQKMQGLEEGQPLNPQEDEIIVPKSQKGKRSGSRRI